MLHHRCVCVCLHQTGSTQVYQVGTPNCTLCPDAHSGQSTDMHMVYLVNMIYLIGTVYLVYTIPGVYDSFVGYSVSSVPNWLDPCVIQMYQIGTLNVLCLDAHSIWCTVYKYTWGIWCTKLVGHRCTKLYQVAEPNVLCKRCPMWCSAPIITAA